VPVYLLPTAKGLLASFQNTLCGLARFLAVDGSDVECCATFPGLLHRQQQFCIAENGDVGVVGDKDIDVKLPTLGDAAVAAVGTIERLMANGHIVEASSAVKARAAERALASTAPFYRNRNSIADAIIIELYADAIADEKARGTRFAFVTHNKNDFSLPNGDHRKPHPDLAASFSKIRSLYCTSLVDALRRVDPRQLSDEMEIAEIDYEPRSGTQIGAAIDEYMSKMWYGRHKLREEMIADGRIKLVEKHSRDRPIPDDEIQREIWAGALKSAQKVEKRYGLENLGPWDDFEWGMINGKVSALRWVMGEDWDELYT